MPATSETVLKIVCDRCGHSERMVAKTRWDCVQLAHKHGWTFSSKREAHCKKCRFGK